MTEALVDNHTRPDLGDDREGQKGRLFSSNTIGSNFSLWPGGDNPGDHEEKEVSHCGSLDNSCDISPVAWSRGDVSVPLFYNALGSHVTHQVLCTSTSPWSPFNTGEPSS